MALDRYGTDVLSGDWRAPRNGRAGWLTGYVTVLVRLDMRAWRGRNVRVYQVLPPQPLRTAPTAHTPGSAVSSASLVTIRPCTAP